MLANDKGEYDSKPARGINQLDVSREPIEMQQAWAAFKQASKPRALAWSANGFWGLAENSPRIIDAALAVCHTKGGKNCRLLAIDDEVATYGGRSFVGVQMGDYNVENYTTTIEHEWLPIVRQAAAQFDRLVNDTLQVKLMRDATIYIGVGEDDYRQILINDMHVTPEQAELTAEVSGGLSGRDGKIALKFTGKQSREMQYSLAVKTTLHELTHELQKQIKNSNAGFNPPAWIKEGTANLIAYLLAPQMQINDSAAEPLRNWRVSARNWWRYENRTNLQPEDMIKISHTDWLKMMKEKRGNYQMADLMCIYLQAISGDDFLKKWVTYFQLSGVPRSNHSTAFEQAFGINESEFHADFKRWLAQL
ncbi:hypothetical protein [Undibacterium sp. RuTC16W]|uniref:hypothetical protein n=1 Tax=Undibacterium sp. RuTC16W TaxID=3413048 RepID=UPI003BEFBCCA